MSRADLENYRRSTDAWSRGDRDAWLSEVTPDWEFRSSGVFPGLRQTYRGLAGARLLWEDMRGPWVDFEVEVNRLEDLGDVVLALITFEVTGRDGLKTRRPWAHVVTQGERGLSVTENYASWDEALRAVGLEE